MQVEQPPFGTVSWPYYNPSNPYNQPLVPAHPVKLNNNVSLDKLLPPRVIEMILSNLSVYQLKVASLVSVTGMLAAKLVYNKRYEKYIHYYNRLYPTLGVQEGVYDPAVCNYYYNAKGKRILCESIRFLDLDEIGTTQYTTNKLIGSPQDGVPYDYKDKSMDYIGYLEIDWNGYATSKQFRRASQDMLNWMLICGTNCILFNAKRMKMIGKEDQEWVVKSFSKHVQIIRKMAIVKSEYYFNQLGLINITTSKPDIVGELIFVDDTMNALPFLCGSTE